MKDQDLEKKSRPDEKKPENPNIDADALKGMLNRLQKDLGITFDLRAAAASNNNNGDGYCNGEESAQEERRKADEIIRRFSFRPREIRDRLDRFVISQDEAKKVLATAVCDHYNHLRRCLDDPYLASKDFAKSNVIMIGPTGVGKTYLMRCIAKMIGVPFVKADATKFSETGYMGYDVEDIIRDLVKVAEGNIELARYGIVYIDEVDKIASRMDGQKDVSGRGVQINLLKLLEETDVRLVGQNDMVGQMKAAMTMENSGNPPPSTISTKFILFIVSGAFDRLDKIIRKRIGTSAIGFAPEVEAGGDSADETNSAQLMKQVRTEDIVKYGFEPEFIGRLPVRVALENLGVNELEQILTTAENGIWQQYVETMAGYGIALTADQDALHLIAEAAAAERTGARGLLTVLERILRDFKFELPGTGIDALHLTPALIKDPQAELQRLLAASADAAALLEYKEVEAFAQRFQEEHGFELSFTHNATEKLVQLARESKKTVRGYCESAFKDFHYGLELIARNTDKRQFLFDEPDVLTPKETLSRWVKDSYNLAPKE